MTTLVYEMEMDDFGKSLLETDPSFKIEVLETLSDEEDLLLKYKVRVTEERPDE
jgi:hypothetical protein